METVTNWLKKPWVIVSAVIAGLLFYIKILKKDNNELEADALNSDTIKKDAVLEERQNNIKNDIKAEQDNLSEEKKKNLTDKELEDYLKKI